MMEKEKLKSDKLHPNLWCTKESFMLVQVKGKVDQKRINPI